jgi:hypothetical protein
MMTTTIVDSLWPRLHAILNVFADRLVAGNPTLIRNLARTANDAFVLRGYLALRRHADGDEVAITIDVRSGGQQLILESEACTDDGRVIADGPSTVIPSSESQLTIEVAISDWLRKFERFLLESEPALATAVSKLS